MKNIPEIRIKGFEGEWKESVLQENLADNLRTNTLARAFLSDNDGEVLNVHYGDVLIKYGSLLNAAKDDIPHIKGSKAKDYSDFIQDGDIIFADTAEDETAGKCVEVINVGNNNIVSGLHTIACRPKHTFGKGFLGYYINSPKYHEQLYPLLQGIKVFSLNKSQLEQTEMRSPESLAEQQSLGSFFSSFDRLLSDHHRRLENLRRVKKSMLQKMFPQQGQTVPEIRFKGFSGEWKEMKLGDVGTIISGVGFPNKEQGGKHGIPFYKVSDMNNKGNETMMINANNYVTKQQIEKYHWKVCEDVPAIFFAKVGAAIFFDRKRLVTTPCLFDNNTMVYCLDKEFWDATFCLKLFEHIKLSSLSQVGSLPSFNGTAVENISVLIPSKAEQHLIGSFLTSLDNLINDEVNYIDQLTRVKSTLLQKMFV